MYGDKCGSLLRDKYLEVRGARTDDLDAPGTPTFPRGRFEVTHTVVQEIRESEKRIGEIKCCRAMITLDIDINQKSTRHMNRRTPFGKIVIWRMRRHVNKGISAVGREKRANKSNLVEELVITGTGHTITIRGIRR